MKFLERQILLAALVSLATLALSDLAIARTLNYQGNLVAAGGKPVNVSTDITIRFYGQLAGGIPIYDETHPVVAVTNSLCKFLIGPVTPLDSAIFTANESGTLTR